MENIAIKTNEVTGTLPGINKLGGASLSISFADLLNTTRIEDAGGLFAGRTDITSSKAEAPAPAQDRPRDDGGERHEAKSEATDRSDAPDAPQRESRDDGPAPVRESRGDEPRDGGAPPEKEQAQGGEAGDDGSHRDEAPKQAAEAPGENKPAAAKTSQDDGRTLAAGENVITPGRENATQNAQQVLAGLITGAEDGVKQTHVAAQANERATAAPQRVNALDGLTRAADAVAKQAPTGGGNAGQANTNTHGNQAKGNVQQVQVPVSTDDTAPKAASDPIQQALAKKIGDGARVQVNVVKEAAVLSSRPSATLATASTQAADGGSKPQAGQAATHSNAPSAAGSQAGQAGQQALGNVAGQQAVQQAQAAVQGGGEAKGASQGTLHVNAGQASEGGTPSATVPGGEARQAQQAGQAKQAANTNGPSQPRPAVTEQVTVQITKALQSGVDKISIHLRPASLGRIDVQMEVAKDGHTSIVITADNKETLELLQRDSRHLEQALKDAGLQTDAGNMDFNMREGRESEGNEGGEPGSSGSATADAGGEQDHPVPDGYFVGADGRVDIRA